MQAVSIREILGFTNGELVCGNIDAEITEFSLDSRTISHGSIFIAIRGSRFDGHRFIAEAVRKGAVGIIVEESFSMPEVLPGIVIRVKDTIRALGDIARIKRRKFKGTVIAVTGTAGKTTTKEFIAGVLKERFCVHKTEGTLNNHIGVPITFWGLNSNHETCVVELGMSNLGEISYLTSIAQPDVGIITNIGPAHLERLASIENIISAKAELLGSMKEDGLVILNRDCRYFPQLRARARCRVVTVGRHHESDFQAAGLKIIAKPFSDILEIKYPGSGAHNIYPALFAAAVGYGFNMSPKDIINGMGKIKPPKMRLEFKEIAGISIIDDTYNANPLSMANALDTLAVFKSSGKKIFVCGDMLELGESGPVYHRELGKKIAAIKIDRLITIGNLSELVSNTALETGMPVESVKHCRDNITAVEVLGGWLVPGDVVLVKGSRMMRMEEIVKGIEEYYSTLEKLIV